MLAKTGLCGLGLATALLLGALGSAHAAGPSLDGQSLELTENLAYYGPGWAFYGPYTKTVGAIVGAGTEAPELGFNDIAAALNIDPLAQSIWINVRSNMWGGSYPWLEWTLDLEFTGMDDKRVSALTVLRDDFAYASPNPTFSDHHIRFDISGAYPAYANGWFQIGYETEAVTASVPEPASWALLALGLLPVALRCRRARG